MKMENKKASALVITLIILGIIVVSALSTSLVSVQERKGSIGSSKSSAAYQVADTGIEKVLRDILSGTYATTNLLPGCNSTSGLIEGSNDAGVYTIELKREDGEKISCTSDTQIASVKKIKSTGIVGQNSRAIQVAVEAICSATDPSGNLIGHWKLDEASGTTAADSHTINPPAQQPATVFGSPGRITGKIDGAFDFNEPTDYLDTGANDAYDNLNRGTFMAWINPGRIDYVPNSWWTQAIATYGGHENNASFMLWGLVRSPGWVEDGNLYLQQNWKAKVVGGCNGADPNPHSYVTTNDPVINMADSDFDAWHLVTFINDGSKTEIYWDKELKASNYWGATSCGSAGDFIADINKLDFDGVWPNPHSLSIGSCQNSDNTCAGALNNNAFDGPIDDVQIYSEPLEACQIKDLYDSGSTPTFSCQGLPTGDANAQLCSGSEVVSNNTTFWSLGTDCTGAKCEYECNPGYTFNGTSCVSTADTTAPAAISNLSTTAPTSSSVTLSWTSPGDDNSTGTATTYDIRYSTSAITSANFASASQASGEPTPTVAGSTQTFTVTGLNPSTTYYFAMKTADEVPNWSTVSNFPAGRATSAATILTLNSQINASSNDAEQNLSTGSVSINSTDLELVTDVATAQEVGLRFTNITVPRGATITSTYIEFEVDEASSGATNLTFYAQNADNAPTFTTAANDITSRSKTTASVTWSSVPAWNTVGELKQTPDLSAIIQAVVNRAGWTSGNALAVIVAGSGSRVANAYDFGAGGTPARLHVEYAIPSSSSITVNAKGVVGNEQIELKVNGNLVDTWTLSTILQNYTASAVVSASDKISVEFPNDNGDVRIDYITVDATRYEAEDQAVNTGGWNSVTGTCGDGVQSEWLHCAGYIEFPMAPPVKDDFNRENENPLSGSGNWSQGSFAFPLRVVSNEVVHTQSGSNDAGAAYIGGAFSEDQYSQAKVTASQDMSVNVRIQSGVNSEYNANINGSGPGTMVISKTTAGSWAVLDSIPYTTNVGDVVKFTAIGNNPVTLRVYVNGNFVMSHDDYTSVLRGGRPGLGLWNITGKFDDWQGGSL